MVRAAKDLGFNITLIGDACATKNLQFQRETVSVHEVKLSNLAALNGNFATVISAKQFSAEK